MKTAAPAEAALHRGLGRPPTWRHRLGNPGWLLTTAGANSRGSLSYCWSSGKAFSRLFQSGGSTANRWWTKKSIRFRSP
jgi:hypothetical protein